jgi:hypothetical protein
VARHFDLLDGDIICPERWNAGVSTMVVEHEGPDMIGMTRAFQA